MIYRELGKGVNVSVLGYGAGHIGGNELSEKEIEILLNEIVDRGINFFDTARGYGMSEERIGKYLSKKRDKLIYSTKVGYGIEGYQDWTYECITEGVNTALKNLKTDYIDVVHLHSCDLDTLKYGEVIGSLVDAQKEGKIKLIAYSGENQELEYALNLDIFDVIQTSVNIFDQRGIDKYVIPASKKGVGVIAKRPMANVPWRYIERPVGQYCEEYWQRMQEMNLNFDKSNISEYALRFTAFTEGVTTCIVGSRNIKHIDDNIKYINKEGLDQSLYTNIRSDFQTNEKNWLGQI